MSARSLRLNPHPFADRWNHNSHYYPRLAAAIPADARVVLDVGCGDGTFARYVTRPARRVIGLELDPTVIPTRPDGVDYLRGSAQALPLANNSVDAVTMIMVVHHVDPGQALMEVQRVLRPGGTFALLGYGFSQTPYDFVREGFDIVLHHTYALTTRAGGPDVRLADPTLSWADNRRLLESELPGGRYRRLPMWRFEYCWTAPTR